MADIFSVFKYVRPRKTILSDDFNGLQSALKTSFDTLGTQAPSGSFGVSSSFYVGDPSTPDHAINVRYLTANVIPLMQESIDAATVEADRATVEADRAETEATAAAASAALAEALRFVELQPTLDAQDAQLAAFDITITNHLATTQAILDDYEVLIYAGL